MASIVQQAITLNSQNQLRNADRLARDWAIAHAGVYQSQARKELGGSLPLREWKNDGLTIRIAKLTSGSFKQVQLVSVNYAPGGGAEPYAGYIMTYAYAETEQSGGHCISVASLPDALANAELPWDDKAGPVGLERAIAAINADRTRPARSGDAQPVTTIDNLFAVHNTAIVLTEDGEQDAELRELADAQGDWADLVSISTAEQLAISRELPDHKLPAWVRAKIAVFSRYADEDGNRLRLAEADCAQVTAFLDEERDRIAEDITAGNTIAAFKVLESVSILLTISMLTDAKDMAEALVASAEKAQPAGTDAEDSVTTQQRIYLLEDRLTEANDTIDELRERLAQYESYDAAAANDDGQPDASETPSSETIADSNRHNTVLDAIANPERFPRLRFLTNCDKALADYGKPRPNGVEIVAAIDAINNLARAWYNTPSGAIGPWDNYFIDLPGWKHADDESDTTMAQYGDKRSFSDQDKGRHVTITRHLTYQGSSGGLQIYFDRDDATDKFIVGYIGEHLPYATARS